MIFFDLDGTLLDHKLSEYLGVKALYKINKEYFNVNQNEFYHMWCNISEKNFRRFLDGELTFENQRNERIKEIFALSGVKLSDDEAEKSFKPIYQVMKIIG
ncbi:hypothetical protein CLPU_13c00470 [Gottschalkia purinilytica]|uniref:Haloacid dehalogenase-like hydrolase n=1 Tax=Gottschalkia purinilytica TaxID=1503 RepID=A0A0L0W8T3_GOTPU|nr:hypothetical protein [Gottschalkia purinilytica]KNF07705.1 hypothetical protein CLPU_13c00470 [Gottschalkia purinilytica]